MANKPGMEQVLNDKEAWLNNRFGNYFQALQGSSAQYGDVISKLLATAQEPIQLGVGGQMQSFIPASAQNRAASLAASQAQNAVNPALQQWSWEQANPQGQGEMDFFNLIKSLMSATETSRYGLPSESASYNSKPDWATTIGNAGKFWDTGMNAYNTYQGMQTPETTTYTDTYNF
jgi:hypothetical protein